jgi:hypothetical protein
MHCKSNDSNNCISDQWTSEPTNDKVVNDKLDKN